METSLVHQKNYHRCCWDTGKQHPEGTAGMLVNCPIESLSSRSGIGPQETLPVNRQQLLLATKPEASPVT